MKFTCSICGYVYEEEKEGVPFSELSLDWTCPSCGAQKAMFDPVKVEQPEPSAAEGVSPDVHHELKKLSAGALSLLFSNLARGCEKQYRPAEQKQYLEIAGFFASLARKEKAEGDLASIVSENLSGVYNDAEASASAAGDRGALRARLWSYKVEMIARTILSRYEKEGEKMLENASVWVCSVCGFVFIGKSAPALCPVCKVPSWKFDKVE